MINSKPRFHNLGQIPIAADELDFLTHNSYIDLSKVPLIEQANLEDTADCGELPPPVIARIEQAIFGVDVLSERNHQKILANIN